MSDFGATDQFSLHRFARPLTTSALLPMRRRRPMTFFLHVPMRRNMSLCSASLRIRTSSSMLSTSYSMFWISGPNASVMSSMRAYEIQSEVTLIKSLSCLMRRRTFCGCGVPRKWNCACERKVSFAILCQGRAITTHRERPLSKDNDVHVQRL